MQVIARAASLPIRATSAQGASSTAEFYFDNDKGVDAIVTIPISQVLHSVFTTGASGVLASPAVFYVRAGGRINAQAGTTPDFQVRLDAGDDSAFANNTTVADSGSIVLDNDTTIQSFYIEAKLILAPTNSKLQGEFSAWVNNTVTARTVLTESVEDLVANKKLNFKVSGQFSESIASQTAQLDFLEVLI